YACWILVSRASYGADGEDAVTEDQRQLRLPGATQRGKALIVTVEVRRSARRTRTVSARLEDRRLIVYVPARMSRAEEAEWVDKMATRFEERERRGKRNSTGELERRAQDVNRRYFDGEVRWVGLNYGGN